jgi:5-methylcytosine-specific restriction enzyme subunit McrC
MVARPRPTTLTEYERTRLPASALPAEAGRLLWQKYGVERRVVDVAFPSPRTEEQWELISLGWVGHIPLTPALHFHLQPRAPLGNLFRMLAFTCGLHEADFLPGLVQSDSLRDFYEQLARRLAAGVLARRRRGLYRAYVRQEETLPYVRGRLRQQRARPWQPELDCIYEEDTVDVADNQLLALALRRIATSGLCGEAVQASVRQAFHGLPGITPAAADAAATGRRYHRLNADYAPLHALCHFFLTHTGPGHHTGEQQMLPFLVHMPRLYEQFVARWLQQRLPPPWRLRAQEQVAVGEAGARLDFTLDMVLYDGADQARVVLDTKYKTEPTVADIHQIVTYAELRHCPEAMLVYPQALRQPLDVQIGHVRLRAITFGLEADLETEGRAFLAALGLGKPQHDFHKSTII